MTFFSFVFALLSDLGTLRCRHVPPYKHGLPSLHVFAAETSLRFINMVHNEVNKFTNDRYSELPNFITRQQLRQQNNKITYLIACVTLYTLYCQFNNKIPARKTNVAAKHQPFQFPMDVVWKASCSIVVAYMLYVIRELYITKHGRKARDLVFCKTILSY